jgi:hypothetical protein
VLERFGLAPLAYLLATLHYRKGGVVGALPEIQSHVKCHASPIRPRRAA